MSTIAWVWLPILLLLTCIASEVCACFAVIVGRGASADGSVLVGHNEENGGRRVLNFRRVGRRQFDPGSVVPLQRGGRLEQVPQTWAFLWSENPGLEFSDGYLNEWGVAVVSDACPTREDHYDTLVDRGEIRQGGIGYMLRRLVAERARSAREGVLLAGGLVERFGYVHSGRTYVIADPSEAWLLSVVCGRRWVAQRVPDDAVVVLPNVYVIGRVDLDDPGRFLASPDLIDYAADRGWFDPASGEPFNFRLVYQTPDRTAPDVRQWRGQQLVTGVPTKWPPERPLPMAVRPAEKMTVAGVAAILRNRTEQVSLFQQGLQESAVFQLRADLPAEIGCVWWRTTARPDTGVFTPWYLGIAQTPACYYRPADVSTQLSLDHHFAPPQGTFDEDPNLAWWKFKTLQDLVDEDYQQRITRVHPVWSAFERRLFRRQTQFERRVLDVWKNDENAARALLTEYSGDTAAAALREAEQTFARLKAPEDSP